VSLPHDLHELWGIVGDVWDAGDIAGRPGPLRAKAGHWRGMHADLLSLADDVDRDVGGHLTGGAGGAWNDAAGDGFREAWAETRASVEDLAAGCAEMADHLDQFADQVDSFNDNLHTCLVVIGASVAVMAATTWIPGMDVVTDGASLAADAAEVEEATGLLDALRSVLQALAQKFGREFLFGAARSLLVNYPLSWGSRLLERGLLLGDPTEGWSKDDRAQLLLLAGLTVPVSLVVPMTALGRWAALPEGGGLALGPFARASLLRLGQTLVLANGFNLLNQAWIEGHGGRFPVAQTVQLGSTNTVAQTLLVVGGDALALLVTRGRSQLPQALTLPALTGVSTWVDVGIPGLSPLLRRARGLEYATAGGGLTFAAPPGPPPMLDAGTLVARLPVHVVRPGDTLWAIARRQYGDPVAGALAIQRANHVADPRRLRVGQRLMLPPIPAA
jgi:hypothetical protein